MPVATFGDLKKGDKDKKPQGPGLFTGGIAPGGGGSGQNVLPNDYPGARGFEELEKRLRAAGAMSKSDFEAEEAKESKFSGAGYRLGDSSEAQAGPSRPAVNNRRPTENKHVVKIFKGGFTVDDGEFKSFEDSENMQAFDALQQGRVPVAWGWGPDATCEVIGSNEEYKAPSAQERPFQGVGRSLKDDSSSESGPSASHSASSAAQASGPVVASDPSKPPVDDSKPLTNIRVRLVNGKTIQSKFNTESTIGDIRSWVASATPDIAFNLSTTFPRKTLTNDSATLQESDLLNAALQQTQQS